MRGSQAALAVFLCLALAVCGCASRGIRVLCLAGTPGEQLLRDRIARAYEGSGGRLAFETAGSRDELIVAAQRRPAPDAIWASDAALAEVDKVTALEDLTPRLRAAGGEQAFASSALELCRAGERLRALPMDLFVAVLYFNEELCARAHVEVPASGWTWAHYAAAARKLTSETGAPRVYGTCRLSELEVMLLQAGVQPFDPALSRCTVREQPGLAQALTFYVDLRSVAWPAPDYDVVQVFGCGRAAMFVGSSRWVSELSSMTDITWDVRPPPTNEQQASAVPMGAICIAVPREARKREEAWEFASFCASREGQQAGGDALLGAVPAYTAAATLPTFAPARPTSFAALVQAAYQAPGSPRNWASSYWKRQVWPEQLERLLAGEQTVEQTLANLQTGGERVLKTNLARAAAATVRERR